jgi:two-component system, NarL family, nitrate/nitrite response regulator NarL
VSADGAHPVPGCGRPLTCLIVDDSTAFLAAATRLLEGGGLSVVGVASTASTAVSRAEETRPELALIDVDLGEDDGFDVAELLASLPDGGPAVILISVDPRDRFLDRIAASSAVGFIAKIDLSAQAIEKALRAPAVTFGCLADDACRSSPGFTSSL